MLERWVTGRRKSARREITKKEACAYAGAAKKERGAILDRLVAEVGWSRVNARRQLHVALARRGPARAVVRQPRPRTYTYDTVKVLQCVWLVSIDTVAHCGHSTKGQYAFTLTVTDPFTGWTVNRVIKNKAARWVAEAMEDIAAQFPYPIDHVHSDNGSEFLNDAVTSWADVHESRMTRSRAEHSNDNPFADQKNRDSVRRSTFAYRYDTETELALLRELWSLANQRKNLFLPTKKAIGQRLTKPGRHVREYDRPRTPAERVRDTGVMLPPERLAMAELHHEVDLAAVTRRAHQIQRELIRLAAAKTYSQAQAA